MAPYPQPIHFISQLWILLLVSLAFSSGCESSSTIKRPPTPPTYVIPDSLIPQDSFWIPPPNHNQFHLPMSIPILSHPDLKLLRAIQSGGVSLERATQRLYHQFQGLIGFGQRVYQLDLAASQDVFTDTIVAVVQQVKDNRFRQECTLGSYIHQIYRNRCAKYLRKQQALKRQAQQVEWFEMSSGEASPLCQIESQEALDKWEARFHRISLKCRNLLWDSLVEGYPPQEVKERHQLSSAASVATLKCRYLKQVREKWVSPSQ